MSEEAREAAGMSAWTPRDDVRAFYSGHSLSDGVPEVVEQIASSLGHRLDFEAQVLGYSLLRQRTKGEVTSATEWPGYRAGQNRKGAGLNVAEELRQPRRLASGDKYDVLVVTERHDLPAIARKERTAFYLTDMARHLLTGNPDAEVLLYHTWLNLDPDAPWPWIDYERAVLPMWECVASRANLDLPARGNVPRVRVLPGGGALAELAAALWEGKVPGVAGTSPGERVRLLFSDNVHMSDAGRYFIALVHYAVLFGRNPEGAAIPASLAPETRPVHANAGMAICCLIRPAGRCRRAARHGDVPGSDAEGSLPGLCGLSKQRPAGSCHTQAPVQRLSLRARVCRCK